jgi:hypothetical protein
MVFYQVAVILQEDTAEKYTYHSVKHTTLRQNTAHRATQNNKEHVTRNEYNVQTRVKLSPQHAVEAYRVVRC